MTDEEKLRYEELKAFGRNRLLTLEESRELVSLIRTLRLAPPAKVTKPRASKKPVIDSDKLIEDF